MFQSIQDEMYWNKRSKSDQLARIGRLPQRLNKDEDDCNLYG